MKKIDLKIGARYNNWVVLENIYKTGIYGKVKVKCDCGIIKIHNKHTIKNNRIKKCLNCSLPERALKRRKGVGEMSGFFWNRLMANAKSRDFKITISREYAYNLFLKQNKKCALSGLEITLDNYIKNSGTASLDRIDSKQPYIENNVQWVHKDINMSKGVMSQESFIKMCKCVAEHNK